MKKIITKDDINLTLEIDNLSVEKQEEIKKASAITFDGVTFIRKDIASKLIAGFHESHPFIDRQNAIDIIKKWAELNEMSFSESFIEKTIDDVLPKSE